MFAELVDHRPGARVLPGDRGGEGTSGTAIPDDRRLALVGKAERDDVRRRPAGEGQRLGYDLLHVDPQLVRVLLHPTGPRERLLLLELGDRHHAAVLVEEHAA